MHSGNYNSLDSHLHKLSSLICLKDKERKTANKQLVEVMQNHLIPTMKAVDEDFKRLYQRTHYVGSYYENLRICEPNEFDLNLELKCDFKKNQILHVCDPEDYPGYVRIKYVDSYLPHKWVSADGYVLQNKVLSWIQAVVDKALHVIKNKTVDGIVEAPWVKMWRKTSGPAVTLNVEYKKGNFFSIDIVPVFSFKDNWPEFCRKPLVSTESALEWCVVPKPNINGFIKDDNRGTYWRMSFYKQEKEVLNNSNHLKNVLKLFKSLRDKEGWHVLSSYHIKTLFLWIATDCERNHWNSPIGYLTINMLNKFRDFLEVRKGIPFFWNEKCDLLFLVDKAEITKISCRLKNIINKIERSKKDNPQVIVSIFDPQTRVQHGFDSENSDNLCRTPKQSSWKHDVGSESQRYFQTYSTPHQERKNSSSASSSQSTPQENGIVGIVGIGVIAATLAVGGVMLFRYFCKGEEKEKEEKKRRNQPNWLLFEKQQ